MQSTVGVVAILHNLTIKFYQCSGKTQWQVCWKGIKFGTPTFVALCRENKGVSNSKHHIHLLVQAITGMYAHKCTYLPNDQAEQHAYLSQSLTRKEQEIQHPHDASVVQTGQGYARHVHVYIGR